VTPLPLTADSVERIQATVPQPVPPVPLTVDSVERIAAIVPQVVLVAIGV
jgi:hypothetical protein